MGRTKEHSPRDRKRRTPRRMWWMLGLGVPLIVIASFLVFRGPVPEGEPDITGTAHLVADKHTIDLGAVRLGQTVAVHFELRNDGDGTLRFQESPYVEVVEGC